MHVRCITPVLFTKAPCAPARHTDVDVLAAFQTAFNKGDKAETSVGELEWIVTSCVYSKVSSNLALVKVNNCFMIRVLDL